MYFFSHSHSFLCVLQFSLQRSFVFLLSFWPFFFAFRAVVRVICYLRICNMYVCNKRNFTQCQDFHTDTVAISHCIIMLFALIYVPRTLTGIVMNMRRWEVRMEMKYASRWKKCDTSHVFVFVSVSVSNCECGISLDCVLWLCLWCLALVLLSSAQLHILSF